MRALTSVDSLASACRYELSYNEKVPDDQLVPFFSASMAVSAKGVQMPEGVGLRGADEGSSSTEALAPGVRAYLDRRRVLCTAFPDLQYKLLEQTIQGNTVFTSCQFAGTHLGPYPDTTIYNTREGGGLQELAPSGTRVHVHGIAIDTIEDGLIIEHSMFYDEAQIRAQLEAGLIRSGARDTRSILRRAKDSRARNDSPIIVQLYLNVGKQHQHDSVVVSAMMRPVVSTAPRYSPEEVCPIQHRRLLSSS